MGREVDASAPVVDPATDTLEVEIGAVGVTTTELVEVASGVVERSEGEAVELG